VVGAGSRNLRDHGHEKLAVGATDLAVARAPGDNGELSEAWCFREACDDQVAAQ
jgi:hypothetical protein